MSALSLSFCLRRCSVGKIGTRGKVGEGKEPKSGILSSSSAFIAEAWHFATACFLHSECSGSLPYQSSVCSGIGILHVHFHVEWIASVDARLIYDPDGFAFFVSYLMLSAQNLILRKLAAVFSRVSVMFGSFHKNPGGPKRT